MTRDQRGLCLGQMGSGPAAPQGQHGRCHCPQKGLTRCLRGALGLRGEGSLPAPSARLQEAPSRPLALSSFLPSSPLARHPGGRLLTAAAT